MKKYILIIFMVFGYGAPLCIYTQDEASFISSQVIEKQEISIDDAWDEDESDASDMIDILDQTPSSLSPWVMHIMSVSGVVFTKTMEVKKGINRLIERFKTWLKLSELAHKQ